MAMGYGGTRETLRWYTKGRRLLFDGKKNDRMPREKKGAGGGKMHRTKVRPLV